VICDSSIPVVIVPGVHKAFAVAGMTTISSEAKILPLRLKVLNLGKRFA